MAIVQISRITQRKGLQENLPQLAGAELGWSIDERRLFIGNGTLEEGAPVIGNTEILTEFSDILEFQTNYTYKGESAGYTVQTGATSNSPISLSLQTWLDQFATVKDFGAKGDGITDDTAAINRALYQLYCRENNVQVRRALFFPAGVYKISETIVIPPFATLYGEGADNSIIQMATGDDSALRAYVARTGDSLQQTGINIGDNSATAPQDVTIVDLAFQTLDPDVDVFLVEDATSCTFDRVSFIGPLGKPQLTTDLNDVAAVRFGSTPILVTNNITFNKCVFQGLTFGINTDQQVEAISVTNSKFDTLYRGVVLGTGTPVLGGPTGFTVLHNFFDNIYAEGIAIGAVSLNGTGHNIFYDVGNHFNGITNPATSIININNANNISVGDMFARSYEFSLTYPRIELNDKASIAFVNSEKLLMGTYARDTGQFETIVNNTVSATELVAVDLPVFSINYRITRDTEVRTGTLSVANVDGSGTLTYNDDYVENSSTGVTLSVTQSAGVSSVRYTSTNTGVDGRFSYSINYLV